MASFKGDSSSHKGLVEELNTTDQSPNLAIIAKETIEEEEGTIPLLGTPRFFHILSRCNAAGPFHMGIATHFHKYLLKNARIRVTLSIRNKTWEMNYTLDGKQNKFDKGWKAFALDNKLKTGDGLVFELIDGTNLTDLTELKFRVQILRGDLPPEIAPRSSWQ
ncbi:hypothetical protein LUZ60_007332 [Juncus effusus]|nr:hypothetical protein LUZ60_007332 [Juncus effusus]